MDQAVSMSRGSDRRRGEGLSQPTEILPGRARAVSAVKYLGDILRRRTTMPHRQGTLGHRMVKFPADLTPEPETLPFVPSLGRWTLPSNRAGARAGARQHVPHSDPPQLEA